MNCGFLDHRLPSVASRVYTGCANKNNPLEKLLYISNGSTSLSQTFELYIRVFAQRIVKISLKQLIWFSRYNSLNFKVHFFK